MAYLQQLQENLLIQGPKRAEEAEGDQLIRHDIGQNVKI